jgi:high-affinity Fe2+/Pb2+ permease
MFATALIVFREVLEAALIIGIVLAACRGIPRRGLMVSGGITAGLAGAVVVATAAGTIAEAASGMGQEILNACILGAAVLMLGWHNVWMSRHGREIARHMGSKDSFQYLPFNTRSTGALEGCAEIARERKETRRWIPSLFFECSRGSGSHS